MTHSTQGLDDAERDGAAWTRYDEYEIVGGHVEGRGARHVYRPLRDYPALFVDFARLEIPDDEDGQAKAALAWAREYGVLGLSPVPEPTRKPGGGLILYASGDPGDLLESFGQGDHRRDSIDAFVREARNAAQAWKFYRAAQGRDLGAIERLDEYDLFRPSDIPRDASPGVEAHAWGMNAAAEITQRYVSAYCRPVIYRRNGRFERGFGFVNLLGAMWLQMYWLLTVEDDELRCLNPRCPKGNMPLPKRDKHDVGRPRKYCTPSCKNQAAQIRRREGHAKKRTTKAPAKSAGDEYAGYRRALQDARDAVIRGDV